MAFKFVVVIVVGADDGVRSSTRRLVSLAPPTQTGVTFVTIQHTLGDVNGSATGGDSNEGPGEAGATAARAETATFGDHTLLAVDNRRIITV